MTTGLLAGTSSLLLLSVIFDGGGACTDVFTGGGAAFFGNSGVVLPSPNVNFAATEATGPLGAFGFLPVASKTLSSPNVNFGVSISGSCCSPVGYGVAGARPVEVPLMKGIGDAAKDTPDLGVCTNVADVGVNFESSPSLADTGEGVCVCLVAKSDGLGAAEVAGVAERPPAS